MSKQSEIMEWLLGPNVTLYTNAERASAPCPACKAPQGTKCTGRKPCKERRNLDTPRSEDDVLAILEKLANRYARPHNPMESYGPRRYPR